MNGIELYTFHRPDNAQRQPIATWIMKPFYTTKEVGKGTGLGLSLSLSIAKRHGGDLKLDSNSLHTKFDLYIPEEQAAS
ncbi:MAG: hypothetical protein H7318_04755 [Oligoflexus sp.]|nr:hypothetical protein [Oligoflexus sp.]